MPIEFSNRFVRAYDRLPPKVQKRVTHTLRLLAENWRHPGLRARKLSGYPNIFYARVDRGYRLTYERRGDVLVLRNVGRHDETLKHL